MSKNTMMTNADLDEIHEEILQILAKAPEVTNSEQANYLNLVCSLMMCSLLHQIAKRLPEPKDTK